MIVKIGKDIFKSNEISIGIKLETDEISRIAKWVGTETDIYLGHPLKTDPEVKKEFEKEFLNQLQHVVVNTAQQNEMLLEENKKLRETIEQMKNQAKPKVTPMDGKPKQLSMINPSQGKVKGKKQ
jgi:hypothetical protein